MRQIATLTDAHQAQRLADYLLTLKIDTRLEPEGDSWAFWVCDEDRVAIARQELDEFLRSPSDPRYSSAPRLAEALRRQEAEAEADYRRKQVRVRERWERPLGGRTVTILLIIVSVGVSVATNFGHYEPTTSLVYIAASAWRLGNVRVFYLPEIEQGEVWRLVTPIFLHLDLMHLAFNMFWLYDLGGSIEARRGRGRFLILVLVLAVFSNLVQYFLGPVSFANRHDFLQPSPFFGGMSGVVFGLFGYVWMKTVYDPGAGLFVSHGTVIIMLVWLVLGVTGALNALIGGVANGGHAGGLIAGVAVGVAPHLWRRLRGSR